MLSSDRTQKNDTWRSLGLRLALFCLPIVIGWAALEWWAARVPDMYSVKRQRFQSQAGDLDTLVIGSSSAFLGIVPELLPGSAFNLATPFETLYEEDNLMTRLLPLAPKLKRVIFQIQYPTFFSTRNPHWEDWRQYCFEQEWSIPPEQVKDRIDCRMWSRLALRTPRFYIERLVGAIRKWTRSRKFVLDQTEIASIDDRGGWHSPKDASEDLSVASATNRLAHHHRGMKADYKMDNIARFDHLLSTLRERKIEIIFVTLPVWQTYRDGMKPECWQETQQIVSQRTNDVDVCYYSFLTVPQFEAQNFWDVDHLNTRGAVRFTQMLSAAMNRKKPDSVATGQ